MFSIACIKMFHKNWSQLKIIGMGCLNSRVKYDAQRIRATQGSIPIPTKYFFQMTNVFRRKTILPKMYTMFAISFQLGQQPPPKQLTTPQPIHIGGKNRLPAAVGIGAARFHSLFWTRDALYTWGLNAGQV